MDKGFAGVDILGRRLPYCLLEHHERLFGNSPNHRRYARTTLNSNQSGRQHRFLHLSDRHYRHVIARSDFWIMVEAHCGRRSLSYGSDGCYHHDGGTLHVKEMRTRLIQTIVASAPKSD